MSGHGSLEGSESVGIVEVATLGRFEIIGPVASAATDTGRPITLLKLLIALGGRAVSADQVSDSLWPDADGYAAHRALITNLQRLRRTIGPAAVVLRGGRLTLDPERIQVDALRLPGLLDQMVIASEPQSILAHADEVLGIYRGAFLPGEFDPPEIISTRVRLHTGVVNGIGAATGRLIRHGCIDDAADLLRRTIAIDDRSELLYRQLMHAYARSARWSDGIEAYRRCCEVLREFHGVGPSSDTEALYLTLLERGGLATDSATARSASAPSSTGASYDEQRQISAVHFAITASDRAGARQSVEATVARHGGTVHEANDDYVLAVFGVPTAHEDDAVRAVRACWALVHGASTRNSTPAPNDRTVLALRCAIESGPIVVRAADNRAVGRLDGEPLLEVGRLLSQVGPGEILIGHTTRSLVTDYFLLQPVRDTSAAATTSAFRVVGETGIDSHFDAAKARGLAPFLGRADELATLDKCLQRAIAGEGGMVAVSGEPGIGKSRLLYELTRTARLHDATFVEAGCRAYGERTPYDPFTQAVRWLLALDATAPADSQARRLSEWLEKVDPGLVRYAPYYRALLSLPPMPADDEPPLASGVVLRRITREAIGALVVQASRARPLLLVLEDWHWADESSDDVLRYLQSLVSSHRVLVAISHRATSPLRGLDTERLDHVRLGPLADDDSIELVRYMLGAAGIAEHVAGLVHARSGGNPFFIEEICHGLRQDAGAEAAAVPIAEDVAIPETVQGMIRSRLDGLEHGAREAALSAAVIGRNFTLPLFLAVHGNREALEDDLDRLKARDLIHQTGVVPEVEYRFKHALTQVVAYDALSPKRRRALHERAGHAIERLYAERLDEHCEALARHFGAANDRDRSVKYLERAGDKAARASASVSAVAHYRQAIELLDAREQTPKTVHRRIDVSCKWAAVSHYVSAHESLEVLDRSRALARRIGDALRESRVLYWMGRLHYVMGNPTDALPRYRQALERVPASRSGEVAPVVHASIGRAFLVIGDLPQSVRELEHGLFGLDPVRDAAELCYSTSYLGLALALQGQFERAFALHEEAVRLARAAGDLTYDASALLRITISLVEKGDWPATIAAAHETITVAERGENPMATGYAMFHEGKAHFMLGEEAAGLALCERGLRVVDASGSHLAFSVFLSELAELHALAGDDDQATALAERALERRASGEGLGLYAAYRALALVAEHRTPEQPRLAQSRLAYAHRVATASGAWPAVAIGRLHRAALFLRQGESGRASTALREAISRFESMGMSWWLEQARHLEAGLYLPRDGGHAAVRRP